MMPPTQCRHWWLVAPDLIDALRCMYCEEVSFRVQGSEPPPTRVQPSPPTLLVVAVDDDPARYDELARRASSFLGWIVVTVEHPDALAQILDYNRDSVLAVLLDHDLRDLRGDPYTGLQVANEVLLHRNVPVIVTSANRAGAKAISAALAEYAVEHRVISVVETAPEERWIGVLAEWAAMRARRSQIEPVTDMGPRDAGSTHNRVGESVEPEPRPAPTCGSKWGYCLTPHCCGADSGHELACWCHFCGQVHVIEQNVDQRGDDQRGEPR